MPSDHDPATRRPPHDPIITPVHPTRPVDPERTLREFRARFHRLSWAANSPDTLMAPLSSPSESLVRFEAQIAALFTAHLKIVEAIHTGRSTGARWNEYLRPYERVRAFCLDWPGLEPEPLDPAALRAPEATRLLYGRPDVVLTRDGPRVVETNFDTAVGGFERPDDLWQLAAELLAPDRALVEMGGPIDGLARYFVDLAAGRPLRVLWIMKDGDDLRSEYARLLARLDREALGIQHAVYHPGDALPPPDGGDGDDGVATVLHRACAILTVNRDRERFASLLGAIARRIRGCTVPVALSHIESKLFLAWLSDPDARPTHLSPSELEAVTALLPWTRLLTLATSDELDRVRRNRGDFVLKKTDSYQALDVVFGCNLSDDDWAALLAAKRSEPDDVAGINVWIVQERVRPQEYRLLEYADAGVVERRTGLSCCPYVLGGRLRGLETWVTPFTPDLSMIHHMQYVPHFLAPAA